MFESGYYPPGAEFDCSAPYNEVEVPERDFDVEVVETLTRTVSVTTQKYVPEFDEEDGHTYANTDDTDWQEVYTDNYMPLAKLMEEMKKETEAFVNDIEQQLKVCKQEDRFRLTQRRRRLKELVANMEGWEQSEIKINY